MKQKDEKSETKSADKSTDNSDVANKYYSPEKRKQLAEEGKALDDGSFPIADGEDLMDAVKSIGRASDQAKAKAFIIKRAKALGKTDMLPEDWMSENSAPKKTVTNRFGVTVNEASDDGEGMVTFPGGLTISDETEQVNGTRYDHSQTSLDQWTGEVFADHGGEKGYTVENIIGTAYGKAKDGGRVFIEGIKYAMSNPLGRLYHDMLVEGHARNFSVGTRGPEPENGVYQGHEIHELSQVGLGNNLSARAEGVLTSAVNSMKKDGMDVSQINKLYPDVTNNKEGDSMAKETKNQDDAPKKDDVQETSAPAEESTEAPAEAPAKEDAPAEAQKEEAPASNGDTPADDGGDKAAAPSKESGSSVDENSIKEMVENAVKPLQEEVKQYKQAFDDSAKEPEWNLGSAIENGAPMIVKGKSQADKQFESLDHWTLAGLQFVNYCNSRQGDQDASKTLKAANEFNIKKWNSLTPQDRMKMGVVKNTLTLSDFGNFVTSPELQTEMEGFRTDYSEVLRTFPYAQTASRDFSWLTRSGDIDFEDVDGTDDDVGTDTLKPVKEYSGSTTTSRLQELAAVTPISTTANLFSAVDLIRDAAIGYRNTADKYFAQLPIARLEQAMEEDATRSVNWDADGNDTNAEKLSSLRSAIASISQGNGVLVMSEASKFLIWDILHQAGAGSGLTESIVNDNPATSLWGRNVVTVPNDLMPTLDDSTTYRSLTAVRPVGGGAAVTVTVNHGVFYVNPANWVGKTNGNLRYNLSTEASYEDGGTVYSAFARNEVLLRGAIFRGGAIKDKSRIKGVRAEAVIS